MTNCGPTKSQNPCGRCLNREFILKSFAANTICMDHFASLVPNHWYWCRSHCCCLASVSCLSSSSLLSVTKTVVTRDYWHVIVILGLSFVVVTLPSHNNGIEMINHNAQLHELKAFLVVVWLSYLQTRRAHQHYHHPPCFQGPRARDCFQCHLLEPPVLQAETRPPERITSHDSH